MTIADDAGKKVTIVEYGDILASNGNDLYKAGLYQHLDAQENLTQLTNSRFIGVKDGCVEIERKGEKQKIPADTVLLSVGFQTDTDAVAEFFGIVPATYYVGDCKNVATIMEANIEEVLTAHELYYEKSEVWIETEKMYEVLYELTVLCSCRIFLWEEHYVEEKQ